MAQLQYSWEGFSILECCSLLFVMVSKWQVVDGIETWEWKFCPHHDIGSEFTMFLSSLPDAVVSADVRRRSTTTI